MEAAANGGFNDLDLDHMPDPAHPSDFVNYINTNGGVCTANEWDDDGDCEPDTFYFANDGYQLEAELLAAFTSILKRTSSGGAASVLSGSTSGEGAIYQALFQQELIGEGSTSVNWTGDVTALFIDSAGYLREDTNGNAVLDPYGTDRIVDMCFDEAPDEKSVRVHKTTDPTSRPTPAQFDTCSDTVFNKDLTDINYLWSGGSWLADDVNLDPVNQRAYGSTADQRHIVSAIDTNGDDLIQRSEQIEFVPASFSDTNAGLLQAADAAEAAKIVNYTRGLDQGGYRSRAVTLNSTNLTWRIGDIIHSSPVAVGAPAEDYDLIYGTNQFRK